ncbi:MAG TPA: chromate transporter [Caulobacteraceae bacterium]|jgi:chromate transporter|nr:chromate transporter [Caulobacteraceae bacterium]
MTDVRFVSARRAAPPAPAPRPGELFAAFLWVGLSGFGGVLPFARRMLVEKRAWLGEAEFAESLALCQTLPGPNIVNLTIVVGARFAGPAGAFAALMGLVAAPVAIVLVLAALYGRYGGVGRIPAMIAALGAAAAGLVAATAARMAWPIVRRAPVSAAPFMLLAFAGVGVMRWPLAWVLLALAPLAIAVAWRWRR